MYQLVDFCQYRLITDHNYIKAPNWNVIKTILTNDLSNNIRSSDEAQLRLYPASN